MGDSKESNMASFSIFCAKRSFLHRFSFFASEKFPGEDFLRKFLKNYPLYFAVIDFMSQTRLIIPEKV